MALHFTRLRLIAGEGRLSPYSSTAPNWNCFVPHYRIHLYIHRAIHAQSLGSRVASSVDMDKCLAWIATFLCLLLLVEAMAEASPYSVAGDDLDDYNDNLARLLFFTRKRSCIRRGGSCDHRPNDCCYNSSCRCNLWGTNCRCQRMGLFQKWGKK